MGLLVFTSTEYGNIVIAADTPAAALEHIKQEGYPDFDQHDFTVLRVKDTFGIRGFKNVDS